MKQSFPSRSPRPPARRRRGNFALLAAAAFLIGIRGYADDTALPARLRELIREALDRNPSLQAARLRAVMSREGADMRRGIDPPQIGIEFYQTPLASFPNPVRNQLETDYFLQQTLPFPGKRGGMEKAERFRARGDEEQARARAHAVARDVRSLYFELCWWDARRRINEESRALVGRLVDIARKQYEVGMGRQADILRAQTELSSLRNQAIALEQSRRGSEGMLNALLDRPVDGRFDSLEAAAPAEIPWTFAQLWPLAAAHRPELQAMDAEARMRESEAAAARREFYPDFMVKGAYKDMDGSAAGAHGSSPGDAWSLMVGVEVPIALWSLPRYQAGYRRARAGAEMAGRERKAMGNMVAAGLQEALLNARGAWNQLELARGTLVPQSEQALQSALAAYQTGKLEFMSLLDAHRMALEARLEYHMAVMKSLQSRAEVERAVGLDADAIAGKISGRTGP